MFLLFGERTSMVICVSEWRKKGNFYNQQDIRAYNLKNEAMTVTENGMKIGVYNKI